MPAFSIEQILGYKNLTGIISNPQGGVPNRLPPRFLSITEDQPGNHATWLEVKNTRQVAEIVQYGSPAKRRAQVGVRERTAVMLHSFLQQQYKPLVLQMLREFDSPERQKKGQQMIAYQIAEFRRLLDNLRLACCYSIFQLGKIHFDTNGNLLHSASGATQTVDYNVSATHNSVTLNGLISASWATAGTDIISIVNNIKTQGLKDTGYELKHVFYGSNVLGYLLKNDGVKELLKTQTSMAGSLRSGVIPDGFCDLNWHPLQDSFFSDSAETNRDLSAANQLTFTPEPDPSWWTMHQGSMLVPSSIELASDASAAMKQFDEVSGMFSYAAVTHNPPGIEQFFGDTMLPTLKVPDAIFIGSAIAA